MSEENIGKETMEFLLDLMYTTREHMRSLEAEKSAEQKIYDEAEYKLTQLMQENNIKSAGTDACTATLKQEDYPQVKEMDLFVQWCAENGYSNMIQKRVSKAVFDEYYKQNGEFPAGVDTYQKLTVLLRKR